MIYKSQTIEFVFAKDIKFIDFYKESTYSSIKKLNKLFHIRPPSITIHVFHNRTSFLKAIHKKKASSWLVAYVSPNNTADIYVVCNDKFTNEQKKKERSIILHELCHLYTNTLNSRLPDWLKEGISVFVADQIYKQKISRIHWEKITKNKIPFVNISWEYAVVNDGYNIAGLLVYFYVKQYGWDKFLSIVEDDFQFYFIENFKKQFVE